MAKIAGAVDYWNMFLDLTTTAAVREVGQSLREKVLRYDDARLGAWK